MRAPAVARGAAVRGASLARWGDSPAPPLTDYSSHGAPPLKHTPYPFDEQINQRFAIWQGDITSLEVDAITNTTDETLSECNAVSERIMSVAGPELKEEIVTRGHECRTGEVVVTPGFSLRCRHVLHTVCPKYVAQYHSAAETSLHNCYQSVLYAAGELNARTLALCVVDTPRRNFPPDLAAHTALRTIRCYLSQHGTPLLVILSSPCAASAALLATLAPLYFPRSAREADAARRRLDGHVDGDSPAHHDRRIRIIHNPHEHDTSAEDDTSLCDDEAAVEAAAAFARACAPDTQRLLAPAPTMRRTHDHDQYERLLRRARAEDLSEVSGIGCLYQSGVDRLGRPVVIFIGKWFPIGDIDLDKALLYLIKLLDPIVRGDYVIAYFHTLAASGNHPPFSWLKEVYTVLPYKYKKNLKAFYIVHPTFWTKMMTWWFTTFMAPAIKAKVHNLPGVEFLYSVMARDQLEVPAFVTEYDMTINGLHYFQPDTSST
ncbi:ganglioside induced differentiation associated protein 2 [Choristoneura fumiferana]|uniref:ganglioside induced differentiation associated protein 2 n=1 Tax=Choristoneura fumiferana TaxID=7141 RepID=UPI003D157402